MLLQSSGPGELSAIFEDNGRVAYAYVLANGEIEGDVWLYNHGEAPVRPEWNDADMAPFKNPFEFAHNMQNPPDNEANVKFQWEEEKDEFAHLRVYIRGELFGVLKVGSKPGWSKLAKKDGPLAKALS
jgi:hypothetical protein